MEKRNKNSIFKRQKASLEKMLNFNRLVEKITSIEPQWKILIYDDYGREIIAPHLSVKELRRLGVTLHLNLCENRDSVCEVIAIYFVLPTEDNLKRICSDMSNNMYNGYHLHFISSISRNNLEFLALTTVRTSTDHLVSKVYDQYSNFLAKSSDLFTLGEKEMSNISYYNLNVPTALDVDIEESLKTVVDGLFSFFVTYACIPMIRCLGSSQIAEHIATALDQRLRDTLLNTRSCLFGSDPVYGSPISFQRPLLLLVDRTCDIVTPLLHSSTYEALIHDTLDYKSNTVKLMDVDSKKITATHELNENDPFWSRNRNSPISVVAGKMTENLSRFKIEEERLREITKQSTLQDGSNDFMADNINTMKDLTDLLNRKKLVEMHTEIASCLLKHIEARKLNVFYDIEKNYKSCVHSKDRTLSAVMDSFTGATQSDLHRFLIACALCDDTLLEAEIDEAADKFGISPNEALSYVRKYKSHARLTSSAAVPAFDIKSVAGNVLDKLINEGARFLGDQSKGVPLLDVIDKLTDPTPQTNVLYFDPKMSKISTPRNKVPYNEVVVFVIGGGCYAEYEAISRYKARKNKNMIYGSTALYSPNDFLEQLNKLGKAYHQGN